MPAVVLPSGTRHTGPFWLVGMGPPTGDMPLGWVSRRLPVVLGGRCDREDAEHGSTTPITPLSTRTMSIGGPVCLGECRSEHQHEPVEHDRQHVEGDQGCRSRTRVHGGTFDQAAIADKANRAVELARSCLRALFARQI